MEPIDSTLNVMMLMGRFRAMLSQQTCCSSIAATPSALTWTWHCDRGLNRVPLCPIAVLIATGTGTYHMKDVIDFYFILYVEFIVHRGVAPHFALY